MHPIRLPLWILAASGGYILCLFAPQILNDGDTYMHIAAGNWIIQHRAVPSVDPFSYTFAGAPWVAHEWLSEVVMAIAYRLGGWSGMLILSGAALALTLGLLARHLSRWLDPLPASLMLLTGAACIAGSLLARPHLLALPLIEIWTAGLLIAVEQRRVPWLLLPLMTLWANLHGSFLFGLALACALALEAAIAAGAEWQPAVRKWGLFLVCSVVAALITPHGWRGLVFPIELMSMKQLGLIGEWKSLDFQSTPPLEAALMAALYVSLSRGVRVPVLRLLMLMGLLHLAFQHARHEMLFGVTGSLLFAGPLGVALGYVKPVRVPGLGKPTAALAVSLFLAIAATGFRLAHPTVREDIFTSPGAAFAHVPASLAAMPVLNEYNFGGFLIFNGVRPFIDGRADMYGDKFLEDYAELIQPNRARIAQTLEQRGIQWVIVGASSSIRAVMEALSGWSLLYADKVAAVYSRAAAP
jgi:hypothetical protein